MTVAQSIAKYEELIGPKKMGEMCRLFQKYGSVLTEGEKDEDVTSSSDNVTDDDGSDGTVG